MYMESFKVISIAFLILLITLNPKQNDPIPLQKYSYLLSAVNSETENSLRFKGNGTGFFLKATDGNTYLITNYHVLSGYSSEEDSMLVKFTDLMVGLLEKNKKKLKDFIIGTERDTILEKKIKENSAADIVALNFTKISMRCEINEISNFFDSSYFDKKPDSIVVYGYPAKWQTQESLKGRIPIVKKIYEKYKEPKLVIETKEDSVFFNDFYKFHLAQNSTIVLPGMSGSPVFGIFRENGLSKIKFIGVVKGQPSGLEGMSIIKAREVLNAIKNAYNIDG